MTAAWGTAAEGLRGAGWPPAWSQAPGRMQWERQRGSWPRRARVGLGTDLVYLRPDPRGHLRRALWEDVRLTARTAGRGWGPGRSCSRSRASRGHPFLWQPPGVGCWRELPGPPWPRWPRWPQWPWFPATVPALPRAEAGRERGPGEGAGEGLQVRSPWLGLGGE